MCTFAKPLTLSRQDDPPSADLDWEKEIKDYVRLRAICMSKGLDKVRAGKASALIVHWLVRGCGFSTEVLIDVFCNAYRSPN
jgi:hypothetical protein